jgi:hypothetical protein
MANSNNRDGNFNSFLLYNKLVNYSNMSKATTTTATIEDNSNNNNETMFTCDNYNENTIHKVRIQHWGSSFFYIYFSDYISWRFWCWQDKYFSSV